MSSRHSEGWQSTSWRLLVVIIAVLAIAFNVATRTSVPFAPSVAPTVHSNSPAQIHQHLNSDAGIWTPPVMLQVALEPSSHYSRIVPAGPPIPHVFVDESLANRPPPSC